MAEKKERNEVIPPDEDYYLRYLRDTPSPEDAKLDPKLQDLLQKLYYRQREQWSVREGEEIAECSVFVLGGRNSAHIPAQIWNEHRELDRKQNLGFFEERTRYISDFQKAQSIREHLAQESREDKLQEGMDDKPKLSF